MSEATIKEKAAFFSSVFRGPNEEQPAEAISITSTNPITSLDRRAFVFLFRVILFSIAFNRSIQMSLFNDVDSFRLFENQTFLSEINIAPYRRQPHLKPNLCHCIYRKIHKKSKKADRFVSRPYAKNRCSQVAYRLFSTMIAAAQLRLPGAVTKIFSPHPRF